MPAHICRSRKEKTYRIRQLKKRKMLVLPPILARIIAVKVGRLTRERWTLKVRIAALMRSGNMTVNLVKLQTLKCLI